MNKQPGPTILCERIARAIASETAVWFGSMDVANCLARGLAGERLAGTAAPGTQAALCRPVSMILALSSGNNELRVTPNRLAAVAAALNAWAETDQVTEAIVHTALIEVMRLTYGVIVVTVSTSGELSFETANSLAELMKRRAVATMRGRQTAGGTPERRAA